MSNYPNRPFLYNLFSAFRPYPAAKTASSGPSVSTTTTTTANSHAFSSSAQSAPPAGSSTATTSTSSASHLVSSTPSSSAHSQITQAATARAIASKSSSSGQAQGFAQAAAAFSPPTHHHHTKHTGSGSPARRGPSTAYGPQGFGGRARRGSDSSGDEGFVQRPGADKWFVGGKMGNGEERFYKLSMVRRERSNDRKSCDRMSL